MRKLMIAAAAMAAATVTVPAIAQVNTGSGLVAVNIQNVDILKNFLNSAQISALNNVTVPVTVNVPIGVAANVCNVSAAVLAKQAADAAPCDAKSGSKALAQNFVSQVLEQKRGN